MGNPTSSGIEPGELNRKTNRFARRAIRFFLRLVGRFLLFILARVKITGKDKFPKTGPMILAGNHVGVMEVVMMAVYPPYDLEFIGSGDIPLDPHFAWLAKLWGFIPVNRGNLDREAIAHGVDILKGKGVVVIFPEGGIWNPGEMKARAGIALLSGLANSPVIPIGFSGMQGSLKAVLRLKRPALQMNIGEPVPAVQLNQPGLSKKQALEDGAGEIWKKIQELIPNEDNTVASKIGSEEFLLSISVLSDKEGKIQFKSEAMITKHEALARFLLHPVIMDIFNRNLKLPMDALMNISPVNNPAQIARACRSVLDYLDENPGLLTYRFGMQAGLDMQLGVSELLNLATAATQHGYRLSVLPERKYVNLDTGEEVTEHAPGRPNQY